MEDVSDEDAVVHGNAIPGVGSGDKPLPRDRDMEANDIVLRESARPVDDESKAFEKTMKENYKRDMDDLLADHHAMMKKKGISLPSD